MFDPSAPHIIILLVVVLLLFGSKRLPGAASSIGKAMRNFKGEMKSLHDDDDEKDKAGTTAQATMPPAALQPPPAPVTPQPVMADVTQQQLSDLQRQIADLQSQQNVPAGGGAPAPEAQPTQQPF
jgi:sec-independent protein translocase protein TatA